MIVIAAALKVATIKAMTSMNDLSVKSADSGGHRAPVCIVYNSLCDSLTLRWIKRSTLYEQRLFLTGPVLPTAVREFYTYRGNGHAIFMDGLLLSPHASTQTVKSSEDDERARADCFSSCKLCFDHLSKAW
eukprot:scaffold102515_cov63-Attheya_sp.AAC.4